MSRTWTKSIPTLVVWGLLTTLSAAEPVQLTRAEQERFLATAKVVKTKGAPSGITGSLRATLSDGAVTHDAHIQTIDEEKVQFQTIQGTEMNFRDTYKFNIAAYRLDKMLDLGMTPPSIERSYMGKHAAFTWWVDDVMMMEGERLKKKIQAPDADSWNQQMYIVRIFDQLIFNVDRNLGNLLIAKDWKLWMIDHTRAFRLHNTLKEVKNLGKCDRSLYEKLKTLDAPALASEMGDYLRTNEIKGLLARRDKIVQHFDKRGDSAFYTIAARTER